MSESPMLKFSERGGLIVATAMTKFGKFSIKLSRAEVLELAECLNCCPGSKISVAHAVWHFKNRQMARPCLRPDQWTWG